MISWTRSLHLDCFNGTALASPANTRIRRPLPGSWSRRSPQYIGGILEMANARLYRFWADLTPALKTGQPQNEIKQTGKSMFESLYANSARLEQFMDAMSGISMGNFMAFAEKFDFADYETLADIGGATGQLSTSLPSGIRTCVAGAAIWPLCGRSPNGASRSKSEGRSDSETSTFSPMSFRRQTSSRWE